MRCSVVMGKKSTDENEKDGYGGRENVERTQRSRKKKRRVISHRERFEGEIDLLGAILKQSEVAQRELEMRRLRVEKRKLVMEGCERRTRRSVGGK